MRLPDKARPGLSRVLAALLAAGVIYVIRLWHKQELDIAIWLGIYGSVYGFTHKVIDSWINPTDASSPDIAAVATAAKGEGTRSALAEGLHSLAGTLDTQAVKPNEAGQA